MKEIDDQHGQFADYMYWHTMITTTNAATTTLHHHHHLICKWQGCLTLGDAT